MEEGEWYLMHLNRHRRPGRNGALARDALAAARVAYEILARDVGDGGVGRGHAYAGSTVLRELVRAVMYAVVEKGETYIIGPIHPQLLEHGMTGDLPRGERRQGGGGERRLHGWR